jgi:hypothetical protein
MAAAHLAEQTNDIQRAMQSVRAALVLNPQNTAAQKSFKPCLLPTRRKLTRACLD